MVEGSPVDAAKARLASVGEELKRVTGRADELFAERLCLFKTLTEEGVKVAELADLAATSKESVRFALYKDRQATAAE